MDPKLWKLLSILLAIMLLFASLILFYVGMAFIDFKPSQQNITYSCDASYYCYVVEPHPTTNTRQA
jgi:hypothetical protein